MTVRIQPGAAAVLTAAISAVTPVAASVDIHLRAVPAVLQSGTVLLGDVAIIRGSDLPSVRALAHFPLPALTRAGRPRRYMRRDIERLVAKEVPVDQVRWMGADSVAVQPAGIEVPAAAIEQTARIGLLAMLAPYGSYRVQVVNRVEPVTIPPGQLTLRVRPVLVEPHRTTQSVAIEIGLDGQVVRTATLSFLAQQLQRAVAPPPPAQPLGMNAEPQRSLRIAAADPPPRLILRGQQVSVRSRAGMLEIEGDGVALGDASFGEGVDIRTPTGQKLRAKVLGRGQVEVMP